MKNTNGLCVAVIRNLLLVCGMLVSAQAFSLSGTNFVNAPEDKTVAEVLSRAEHPYLQQRNYRDQQKAVQDLYFFMPGELLWMADDFQAQVPDVFCLLEESSDRGLRPGDYDFDHLKSKWQELQTQKTVQDKELALFDTALSISVMRYLADLQRGRIGAQNLGFNFQQETDYDSLVVLILDAVQNRQVKELAGLVEPTYQVYKQLKISLQQYRDMASTYRFPALLFTKSVGLGYSDPQIEVLRRKLSAFGLLDAENLSAEDKNIYQGELVEAVKQFQRLHGLNADGVIGKKTLRALNVPLQQRVRQIEMALERFRWLPRLDEDQPLIFVNIPAFRLWAYQSGLFQGNGDLSMRVVVGLARRNKTPIFMGKMSYLEFGPYWNVPKNITFDEILPKLKESPEYLSKHNMELVPKFGKRVVPQGWSEESLDLLEKGEIKIRQRPGPKNSLGQVKFIFPNRYAVYMHDTPMRKLFRSDRRDFSHGCVRVEQPQALAEFMLRNRSDWRPEEIQDAMEKKENKIVSVKDDIAVLIFYSTAMAIGEEVFFFEDIYGYDETLSQALYQQPSNVSLASITP